MGFAQVAKDEKIRELFERGRDLANAKAIKYIKHGFDQSYTLTAHTLQVLASYPKIP
jgi:hypothetical protein